MEITNFESVSPKFSLGRNNEQKKSINLRLIILSSLRKPGGTWEKKGGGAWFGSMKQISYILKAHLQTNQVLLSIFTQKLIITAK